MSLSSLLNSMPGALTQGMIWGIMAIGVFITFRLLDVADLTVDGSMATGGAVCVMLTRAGVNPWLALLGAFVAGMAAGLVTGLLHTKCGIPAILAGILTQLSLFSINLHIMGMSLQSVSPDNEDYTLLISQRFVLEPSLRNPILLVAFLVVIIICILYWFFGTERGCAIRATGANKAMARAQGINTDVNIIIGLVLSNGLVAASGALVSHYQGSAEVNMGRGAIVVGLAAVIIGEVLFGKVFKSFGFKMLSVVLGAIIYYLVIQIVLWIGLDTNDLKLLSAIVVAIFLAIPFWQSKFRSRTEKVRGEK